MSQGGISARPAHTSRASILVLALLAPLALLGCAHTSKYSGREVIEQHQSVLRGDGFFTDGQPRPELEPVDLIAVNDDMRAFLDEIIPNRRISQEQRVRAILSALLEGGIKLKYNSLKTYTAEEAFYAGEGNCLSFTNLFIALAREVGVVASYQEVKVPPTWSVQGGIYYYYLHINSVVDFASGQVVVVDFDTRSDFSLGRAQHVSDRTAAAQYYNNMAVYYLGEDDLTQAFLHAREAIELRPNTGYFWANLGTILKRAGALDEAEQAYLAAIDIDNEPAGLSNLARLYRQEGRDAEADKYAQLSEDFRSRNPYYLYQRAERAYSSGDYAEANRLIRQAIRKRDDEHDFYRLLGLTWAQLGEAKKAGKSFEKAADLATSTGNASLYNQKLRLLYPD